VHALWQDQRDGPSAIYYKSSGDGGTTWSADTRLVHQASPCEYPSVATSDSLVHIVWSDHRNGPFAEVYYKRNVVCGPAGAEGGGDLDGRFPASPLCMAPNPIVSWGRIPGHEGDLFFLFDAAGRRVGMDWGDRIGAGLAPGIYLAREPAGAVARSLRIVKVR